jgi:chorismate mutase
VLVTALVGVPAQVRADSASPLTPLVDATAQRLEVAEQVAAFKWSAHVAIEDPGRVEQELAKLGSDATDEHLDPDYVVRVFSDQISATEAIEYSRFADWKLNPAGAPVAPPDLSASRSAIDALNNKIFSQISATWSLLESPSCDTQLDSATRETIRTRLLDNLYQRALTSATRSSCRGLPPA